MIFGFVAFIQTYPRPMGGFGHFVHDSGIFLLSVSPWGLATGIGLLRAWRWARISMLVFSGLVAVVVASLGVTLAILFLLRSGLPWWGLLLLEALYLSL